MLQYILIILFLTTGFVLNSQDSMNEYKLNSSNQYYGEYYSKENFDCEKQNPCQIFFRDDFKHFIELKYKHKQKIVYHKDLSGIYYFTINPYKQTKVPTYDYPVRVRFKSFKDDQTRVEIEPETQTGIVYFSNSNGGEKKYLLSECPTLPAEKNGNQLFITTDHPTNGGKFYSLNLKTGKLDWLFLTPGAILMQPIIYENQIILLDDSGNIYWLDKENGSLKSKYKLEEFPVAYPIKKDNIIYFAGTRGYIKAIDLKSGRLIWEDIALIGEVYRMTFLKKGFVLKGGSYSLFNYSNGAKQDISSSNIYKD